MPSVYAFLPVIPTAPTPGVGPRSPFWLETQECLFSCRKLPVSNLPMRMHGAFSMITSMRLQILTMFGNIREAMSMVGKKHSLDRASQVSSSVE
eukprot:9492076-Pyramimonas_sp.AAC.1